MRLLLFLSLLLPGIAGTAMAQRFDSHITRANNKARFDGTSRIEIDLGQHNAVIIGFSQLSQVEAHKNIDSVLRLFLPDYRKIADSTQDPLQAAFIHYRLGDISRTIESRTTPATSATFRFMTGKEAPSLVRTRQDTIQIVWSASPVKQPYYDFSIYLLLNTLSDLEGILQQGGVNRRVEETINLAKQYKGHDLTNPRMSFDLQYKEESGVGRHNFINPGSKHQPFLSFQPGIGAGLIRNQLVPSFNLDVQLIPSRLHTVGYSVGYSSNFFFANAADNRIQTLRNDFLSVGLAFYGHNQGRPTTAFTRQIAAFSIGFPVHRSGPYFQANTIKLSGTLFHKGFFKVQPEIYMNGFFKNVYPGLKIGFGL
ncbi:hypothetical protein [Arsenicibacter rosenii]|uniref:Uncharacterized protein n=1 Tax=Arsenicibacter rosenii TaxID=1750698 RepID=A0A1S2VMD5_9BACT|nr:hypothetical protein [Arsenicibacter rosenii]OIN59919.1 hypothetical protein BLX24_08725 [Arsenicibacter rosenii]